MERSLEALTVWQNIPAELTRWTSGVEMIPWKAVRAPTSLQQRLIKANPWKPQTLVAGRHYANQLCE